LFKKPVVVAVAVNIKGIGCGGMVGAAESFYIRLAVAKGNERI
jgi:hypothetical protein